MEHQPDQFTCHACQIAYCIKVKYAGFDHAEAGDGGHE
jgi:hypothetical protein